MGPKRHINQPTPGGYGVWVGHRSPHRADDASDRLPPCVRSGEPRRRVRRLWARRAVKTRSGWTPCHPGRRLHRPPSIRRATRVEADGTTVSGRQQYSGVTVGGWRRSDIKRRDETGNRDAGANSSHVERRTMAPRCGQASPPPRNYRTFSGHIEAQRLGADAGGQRLRQSIGLAVRRQTTEAEG